MAARAPDEWYVPDGATAVGPVGLELLGRGIAAGMYFIPPGMDPTFYGEKGFRFFTMPWGPWATQGIQSGLEKIKR